MEDRGALAEGAVRAGSWAGFGACVVDIVGGVLDYFKALIIVADIVVDYFELERICRRAGGGAEGGGEITGGTRGSR